MNQKLYLECYAGISGDMTVAALLDLGANEEKLKQTLESLHVDGYKVEISRVKKSGLDACDFSVILDEAHENHDHDMAFLHGSSSAVTHDHHHHDHEHTHTHEHEHTHGHHDHDHDHDHEYTHTHEHEHTHCHDGHEHTHVHSHEHSHEHPHDYCHDDHDHDHNHDHEHTHPHEHEHTHCHDGHEHTHVHSHEHTHDHNDHEHSHDYEHTHPHEHEHTHCHDGHEHTHVHSHEHTHDHHDHDHHHAHDHGHVHDQNHHHAHSHRGLPDILAIIERSSMTDHAKQIAVRIFDILAQAESKAHGVPIDQVHFHEVGAVDSIVDIAAVAICLDDLGIHEVIVPVLYEGCGYIRCQHGIIPVPVPATLNIVADHKLKIHTTDTAGEFVTPTGAAIVAAVRTSEELPERYTINKIGLGAGKRNYERPSLLRAMLITPEDQKKNKVDSDQILKLECNIDDCSGEVLGYAMNKLFEAGARDVNYTPLFMKKNRPGYLITVICDQKDREAMEQILFAETTTIGIRRQLMDRTLLERSFETLSTRYGEVQVKTLQIGDQKRKTLEYESVARIAREKDLPFIDLFKQLEAEIQGM